MKTILSICAIFEVGGSFRFSKIAALAASVTIGLMCSFASAQQPYDFFWSVEELGSGNVVNEDLLLDIPVGESRTINLYYTTDGPSQSELQFGGGLEVTSSAPGIIQFDAAETFDFDIVVAGVTVGQRWESDEGVGHVGPANIMGDFIDMFDFFTVLGDGIVNANTGPMFVDNGYDADADAFLIGSIELTGLICGLTELQTVVGSPISLTNDGFNALVPDFGAVTITVVNPFDLQDGLLTILGTDDDDVIEVSSMGDSIVVELNGDSEEFVGVNEILIDSGDGDDEISVNAFIRSTIFGGDGNDIIAGGPSADTIFGGNGMDDIHGMGGPDDLYGNSDIDTTDTNQNILYGGDGNDLIVGTDRNDMLDGGRGSDEIYGLRGGDLINSFHGNDFVDAGPGNDEVRAGLGNDEVLGGPGNDLIFGHSGADILSGGSGSDQISGGLNNDTITGNSGLDVLHGNEGVDTISGGDGSDDLFGGTENDILQGNSGNDRLFGQAGDDILQGGAGNDSFNGGGGTDTGVDNGESGEISIENT